MWYKFSKTNWVWDIPVKSTKPYAYVKADSEDDAINKLNSSPDATRTYDRRGIDNIDEVYHVPMEHVNMIIFNATGENNG